MATGRLLRQYRVGPPSGRVRDLAFASDGSRLFVLAGNGTVVILDLTPPR